MVKNRALQIGFLLQKTQKLLFYLLLFPEKYRNKMVSLIQLNSQKMRLLGQFSHTRGPAPFQTSADTLNMRTCSHSHIPYVVCWRPVRPPRRVQGCAKMLSTGRPAYGRPAGHPHQHNRPVPGPSRRLGWALWHAGHPHPIWGHTGLEKCTGPP